MAGFFASNAEEYYGMDPNGDLHENYHKIAIKYNEWLEKDAKPISLF